jgi:hypothetical protein
MSELATTYGATGFKIGCVFAVVLYFYPVPVALIIWWFDLPGLFADYMYIAMPFLAMIPFLGWIVEAFVRRRANF